MWRKNKKNNENFKPSSNISSNNQKKSKKSKESITISEGPIYKIIKTNTKKLGRKRKGNNQNSKHNKYFGDNIIRKLKCHLINTLIRFINSSIEEGVNKIQKIKKCIINKKPFLLKVDQKIIGNTNIDYNLNLLKLTLKDLFSFDISEKYKNYEKSYNKKLIQYLYEKNNQIKTIGILNKTVKECLDHLIGTKYYNELQGLEKEFQNILNILKDNGESEEYTKLFIYYVKDFENYYKNKQNNKKNKNN